MASATGNGCTNGTRLVTNVVNATAQKASCFVQCSSGYRTTLSGTFGGRVFCPNNAEEGSPVQYTYQCTENSCAALQLNSVGLRGLESSSSPCFDQQHLSTHSNPSCEVSCKPGYESSTSEATYTCATNAANGDSPQISPSITCVENTCKVRLHPGMTGLFESNCEPCTSGLSLFTHSLPNCCSLHCDAGYVSRSALVETETLTCPQNASKNFNLLPSSLMCDIAITRIEMNCKSQGCESVGNNSPSSTMRSCALVSSQIDTDSSVFVATEGGDEIVFSNFNASSHSESTHWKLFVDDEYSTEDNCVTFSSNNSMTCKIPASSGQDKRLSLMKYVVFEREAREL